MDTASSVLMIAGSYGHVIPAAHVIADRAGSAQEADRLVVIASKDIRNAILDVLSRYFGIRETDRITFVDQPEIFRSSASVKSPVAAWRLRGKLKAYARSMAGSSTWTVILFSAFNGNVILFARSMPRAELKLHLCDTYDWDSIVSKGRRMTSRMLAIAYSLYYGDRYSFVHDGASFIPVFKGKIERMRADKTLPVEDGSASADILLMPTNDHIRYDSAVALGVWRAVVDAVSSHCQKGERIILKQHPRLHFELGVDASIIEEVPESALAESFLSVVPRLIVSSASSVVVEYVEARRKEVEAGRLTVICVERLMAHHHPAIRSNFLHLMQDPGIQFPETVNELGHMIKQALDNQNITAERGPQ